MGDHQKNWPKSWDLSWKGLDKEVVNAKAKKELYMNVKNLLSLYYERGGLSRYCEKMAEFYYYICTKRKEYKYAQSEPIPSWNTMPDEGYGKRLSDSAVHTEFMMVYDLIRHDDRLIKSFNEFNFKELVEGLYGKLQEEIYSAKAMCPVCEAFLTSLYNACECRGVYIKME